MKEKKLKILLSILIIITIITIILVITFKINNDNTDVPQVDINEALLKQIVLSNDTIFQTVDEFKFMGASLSTSENKSLFSVGIEYFGEQDIKINKINFTFLDSNKAIINESSIEINASFKKGNATPIAKEIDEDLSSASFVEYQIIYE